MYGYVNEVKKLKKILVMTAVILCLIGCTATKNTYYEIPKSAVIEPEPRKPVKTKTPSLAKETAKPEPTQKSVTYKTYENTQFGFSVDIPDFLKAEQSEYGDSGTTFVSEDGRTFITVYGSYSPVEIYDFPTLEQIYADELDRIGYEPDYKTKKDNWFVISWEEDTVINYKKYFLNSDLSESVLFMSYPKSEEKFFDEIITHVSKSFKSDLDED